MALWCIAYVAIILMMGYATLCLVLGPGRRSLAQTAGLSLLLGAGNLGLLFSWISMAGLPPSRAVQLVIAALIAIGLGVLWRRRRLVVPRIELPKKKTDWLALLPAALLVYCLVVVATMSLAFPLYEMDAYSIWALKAKVLAVEPLSSRPAFFYEGSLSYSHQDYPLMLPFLTAGLYGMIGEANDQTGKLVCLLLYAGLMLTSYSFLRRDLSRPVSAILTAVLMSLPTMLRWAGVGTADAPLAVFYAGSFFYAARWVRDEKREDLVLAVLFTAYAAFTKNEGKALAAIAVVVLGAISLPGFRRQRLIGWAVFAGGVAGLLLPWLIWGRDLPRTHEDYGSRLTPANLAANTDELRVILPAFLDQVTAWNRWGPLWVLVPLAAVLGWRGFGRRYVLAAWLMAILHVAMYVAVYMVTPLGAARLMPGTLDRLLLHVTPAAVLLIGWHWGEAVSHGPPPLPAAVQSGRATG